MPASQSLARRQDAPFFPVSAQESPSRKSAVRARRPFTAAHFKAWARTLILDTGNPWELEKFQLDFVRDLFAGRAENWLVIPEGNAKTTLVAGLMLYWARFQDRARIVVAASSIDQAGWIYDAAQGFVERSDLGPKTDRTAHETRQQEPNTFRCLKGLNEIRINDSLIKVWAATERAGDGANFTLAILEELHRHRDFRLYRIWRGKAPKRRGQLIAISTAGEPEGEFEQVRAKIREKATRVTVRGAFTRAISDQTVLHEYKLPEGGSPDNMRHVKKANPLKAITFKVLREKYESPSFNRSHWLRFVCGMPAALGSAIGPEQWDPLRADIGTLRVGEEVWLGIRTGQEGGSGIGIVATRADGSVAVGIEKHSYAWPELVAALHRLMEVYDVRDIFIDKRQFGLGAQVLDESGLPLSSIYQSPVALMEATATFTGLVGSGKVIHDGDPELRSQVLGAQIRESTTGAYFQPVAEINAFIGLIMAVHQAAEGEIDPVIVFPEVG